MNKFKDAKEALTYCEQVSKNLMYFAYKKGISSVISQYFQIKNSRPKVSKHCHICGDISLVIIIIIVTKAGFISEWVPEVLYLF